MRDAIKKVAGSTEKARESVKYPQPKSLMPRLAKTHDLLKPTAKKPPF